MSVFKTQNGLENACSVLSEQRRRRGEAATRRVFKGSSPTRNSIVRKKFIFLAHKMDLIIVPKKVCVVPSVPTSC